MYTVADIAETGEVKRGVKISVSEETAKALDLMGFRLGQVKDNRKLGAGTVAAEIVEKVFAEHPDWLAKWFAGIYPQEEEPPAEEPKKAESPATRAKKKKAA